MPQPEGGSLTLPAEDGAQPVTISDVVAPGVATRRGWTLAGLLDELRAAGYLAALVLMASICTGLFVTFKKTKWL